MGTLGKNKLLSCGPKTIYHDVKNRHNYISTKKMGKSKAPTAPAGSRSGTFLNDGRGRYQAMDSLEPQGHRGGSHMLHYVSSSGFGGSMSSADGSFPPSSHPTSPLLGRSPLAKARAPRNKRASSVQPLPPSYQGLFFHKYFLLLC